MRIDKLAVSLRARNPWESFDLGLALARHTGINLFAAFALPYCVFAGLVNLATWGHPTIAILIVWWMKPLFDRIALQVLSQSVFGEAPGWRATLHHWRTIPISGLGYALTLGRFDFARSFHLPVLQLEGQSGRARRDRLRLLDRRARGHAVWLTVVVVHFIYVLIFGLDGLIKLLWPGGAAPGLGLGELFGGGGEPALASQYLFNAIYLVAECVLEPLYVAAGFSLYLSRRTALEGWDLEVAFKRLAARHASLARTAVLVLCCALFAAPPQDAEAQGAPAPAKEKQAITTILAGADFSEHEERREWRRKHPPDQEQKPEEPLDMDFWKAFARHAAEAMRLAAWVAAIVVLGWLLYFISRRLGWFRQSAGKGGVATADVLFGLDLRPASLPPDIPGAARALLAAGDMRGALSLLYRGALRCLIDERELEVRDGDTESDCVRRVDRALPPAIADYFRRLVESWRGLAYGKLLPATAAAAALVDEWARHFAPAAPPAHLKAPT